MFTETILNCATVSGTPIQKPRTWKKSHPPPPPWFKGECIKMKNKTRSLARKLKHSPQDNKIRELLYLTKQRYHHLVQKNKIEYKCSLIEKMHLSNKSE